MIKTASKGRYRAVAEVPQDELEYQLGYEHLNLDDAKKAADDFVAQDPIGFTASVYDDEGQTVYSAGTL